MASITIAALSTQTVHIEDQKRRGGGCHIEHRAPRMDLLVYVLNVLVDLVLDVKRVVGC